MASQPSRGLDFETLRPAIEEGAELDNEIYKHLPEYKRYLEVLRAIGGWQFENKYLETLVSRRPDLVTDETPLAVLEKLYDYSIVEFLSSWGRGYGGSEYAFRYREPRTKIDSTASRFRIHPRLVEVLGLKKPTVQDDGTAVSEED